jgi:hypothetical protein
MHPALAAAQTRTRRMPGLAVSHSLELDRELKRLGENGPTTYCAHGFTTLQAPANPKDSDWKAAPPDSIRALYQAEQLRRAAGPEQAVAHGFMHAKGKEITALNLLYANLVIEHEDLWLYFLNKYLAHTAPATHQLRLSPGTEPRFMRLAPASHSPLTPIHKDPLISVFMPVYNAKNTLTLAAQSILNQTWQNLELFLIDDASTDQSLEIANALKQQDPRVRVIALTTNSGPYIAKNTALQHARGQYITVHDADDWAFPTRLADQVAPLLNPTNQKSHVTIAKMLRIKDSGLITRFQPLNWITEDGAARLCFPSLLFEKNYFTEKLGAWDNVRAGADYELLARIQRFDPTALTTLDTCVMLQLEAPNSITTSEEFYNDERGISLQRREYEETWKRRHASSKIMPEVNT